MVISIALISELKFFPFNDTFRVSLGTVVFFYFLLRIKTIHPLILGVITGICLVLFRMVLEVTLYSSSWSQAFTLHAPTFFYYVTFAFFYMIFKIQSFTSRPLFIGILGTFTEVIASISEIIIRYSLMNKSLEMLTIEQLFVIAFIRSFFMLGFYNLFIIHELRLEKKFEEKKNKKIMIMLSSLYEEMIQLKKTMKNTKETTKLSYDLYRQLKELKVPKNYYQQALKIAGFVHELKKDNQRIYAGLSKLMINEEKKEELPLEEIIAIIIHANMSYSQLLHKNIRFEQHIENIQEQYYPFTIISLLNNLVSNAVESIEKEGTISIIIKKLNNKIIFNVYDNGPGISKKRQPLIFEHGFTTKLDDKGNTSTGIGLSFVQLIVEELNGSLSFHSNPELRDTIFTITLPIHTIAPRNYEQ